MVKILVSEKHLDEAWKYAKKVQRNHKGKNLYSKGAQTKSRRAHTDYIGRIGEIAVSLYFDLSPRATLHWDALPDAGYDLVVFGKTIDVKSTDNRWATRLMWPVTKKEKMATIADYLVQAYVGGQGEKGGRYVYLVGFTTGQNFVDTHVTAMGIDRVVDGTPYMHERDLQPMMHMREELTKQKEGVDGH